MAESSSITPVIAQSPSQADVSTPSPEQVISTTPPRIDVRGLSGLQNIGNTCYLNSALQSIAASTTFVAYLIAKKYVPQLKQNTIAKIVKTWRKHNPSYDASMISKAIFIGIYKQTITYQAHKLMMTMFDANNIVVPRTLRGIIGARNDTFRGFGQQDSQEVLNYILDEIHEETKQQDLTDADIRYSNNVPPQVIEYINNIIAYDERIKVATLPEDKSAIQHEYLIYKQQHPNLYIFSKYLIYWRQYLVRNRSIISDLFMGVFCNEIKCTECNNVNVNFETFMTLSLAIPTTGTTTLDACLRNFTVEEHLNGENQYNCDICNRKVNAIKKSSIWKIPDYLIVQLKRFNIHGHTTYKVSTRVTLDDIDSINLKQYTVCDSLFDTQQTESPTYKLYASIHHTGGLSGGHYYAHRRNPLNDEWYECDDAQVSHVPKSLIADQISGAASTYMMMFRRNVQLSESDDI